MVLLTQSQVSIILSSTIIFLFTFALFLSGYVLQQRTVTDLRAAIRPSVANFAAPPQPPPLTDQVPSIPQNVDIKEHEGDFLAEYYDTDASRQLAHEKLPYILDSTSSTPSPPEPGGQINSRLSYLASLQERGYSSLALSIQYVDKTLHRWIRRVQGKELEDWEEDADWDAETPIELLTARQRRRRIKRDIRRLGVVEDGELRSVYRPRKRL